MLCHFTRIEWLQGIIERGGVLSTRTLLADPSTAHHRNDPHRVDGHLDHVSCSIDYPNAWTIRSYRNRYAGYCRGWIVICIKPTAIWADDTLFCPVNASRGSGRYVSGGIGGFAAMYNTRVPSFKVGPRLGSHLRSCPTDMQAEVLIRDSIPTESVLGVVVEGEQLRTEVDQILAGADTEIRCLVSPEFFDPYRLATDIKHNQEQLLSFACG